MDISTFLLSVIGLCVFEVVSSIDNAVVNADVLSTMSARWRRWFLTWGLFFAVFLVRGLLPWLILWATNPSIGPSGAFMASFSNDPHILESVERAAPFLLLGGGMFLVLLALHWIFLEEKNFAFLFERMLFRHGVWFFTLASLILTGVIWAALQRDHFLALAASIGTSAFFLTHGFKEYAAKAEKELATKSGLSDISKLLYLEVLDASFSIDGVVGAFAFTMSIPVIILGNGLGALVVRQLTIKGTEKIKEYPYLKNGAMYSILVLGTFMTLESFGANIPDFAAPIATLVTIGYFFWLSKKRRK
jgi:uncharacterized protein